jgi:hypothetical protein
MFNNGDDVRQITTVLSALILLLSCTSNADVDASPTCIMDWIYKNNSTAVSQDIRLNGLKEKMNWLVAASFYSDNIDNTQIAVFDDNAFVGGLPIPENVLGFEHPAFLVGDSTYNELLAPLNPFTKEENLNKGAYKSYALFGDISYAFGDQFNQTAGIRYT